MSFGALLIHDVTVYNPVPDADPFEPVRDADPDKWDSGTAERARIDGLGADETLVGRDLRVATYRGFFLATTTLTALSKVDWDGRTLRVKGRPNVLYDRTAAHHVEAVLEEVEG